MDRRSFLGVSLIPFVADLLGGQKSSADESTLSEEEIVCLRYLRNVFAYLQGGVADESFMRKMEKHIDIPEQSADDFRRVIAAFVGHVAFKRKPFQWDSNPELAKAIKIELQR